jgi:hypothetical protein
MSLNATVNRELEQKVKSISGLSNHKNIVRNDLKLICKVVDNMDKRWGLWEHKEDYIKSKYVSSSEYAKSKTNQGSSKKKTDDNESEQEKEQVPFSSLSDVKEINKNDSKSSPNENDRDEIHLTPIKNPYLEKAREYLKYLENILNEEVENDCDRAIEERSKENADSEELTVPEKELALNATLNSPKADLEVKLANVEEAAVAEIEKNEDTNSKSATNGEKNTISDENIAVEQSEDKLLNRKRKISENPSEHELKASLEETKELNNNDTDSSTQAKKIKTSTIKLTKSINMEKDQMAANVLDKLILYLRIVHSIDYYNATEYQQEDWMPNRCGVMHVRGSSNLKYSNTNSNGIVNILNGVNVNHYDPNAIRKVQIDEWLRLFEVYIKQYVDYRDRVDLDLAKRLGLKDLNEEIEKFISNNCKKIEKDVWLCPLSGKKFKGPDYVKKHIETKHAEKLNELRKEVEYFNRFIYDPKRPYLPEHPLSRNVQSNNMMGQYSMNTGFMASNSLTANGGGQLQYDYQSNYFNNQNRPSFNSNYAASSMLMNNYQNMMPQNLHGMGNVAAGSGFQSNISNDYHGYSNQFLMNSSMGYGSNYNYNQSTSMMRGRNFQQPSAPQSFYSSKMSKRFDIV